METIEPGDWHKPLPVAAHTPRSHACDPTPSPVWDREVGEGAWLGKEIRCPFFTCNHLFRLQPGDTVDAARHRRTGVLRVEVLCSQCKMLAQVEFPPESQPESPAP